MNSIDEELTRAEAARASLGSEMKEPILFFREESDRRVEADSKRIDYFVRKLKAKKLQLKLKIVVNSKPDWN